MDGKGLASLPCDQGRIILLGTKNGRGAKPKATILANGLRVIGDVKMQLEAIPNVITAIVTEEESYTTVVVEYAIKGQLRDKTGFLRSIRKKFLDAIETAEAELLETNSSASEGSGQMSLGDAKSTARMEVI